MKIYITFIKSLILMSFLLIYSESNSQSECTGESDRGLSGVKFFLTFPYFTEEREISGTNGISENEIRPVDNEAICSQLNQIVEGNSKFLEMQISSESKGKLKCFYRTDNYYFIFWNNQSSKFENRTIFIVVNINFSEIWEFYV